MNIRKVIQVNVTGSVIIITNQGNPSNMLQVAKLAVFRIGRDRRRAEDEVGALGENC